MADELRRLRGAKARRLNWLEIARLTRDGAAAAEAADGISAAGAVFGAGAAAINVVEDAPGARILEGFEIVLADAATGRAVTESKLACCAIASSFYTRYWIVAVDRGVADRAADAAERLGLASVGVALAD